MKRRNWSSHGQENIIPLLAPGQQWIDDKLIEHGACFPAGGQFDTGNVINMDNCLLPASGSALYWYLSGEERRREAVGAALCFWEKYRDISIPETHEGDTATRGCSCPELGSGGRVSNSLGGIGMGRKVHAMFYIADVLEEPGLLDWMRDRMHWWIHSVGYDWEHHAFPDNVDRYGREFFRDKATGGKAPYVYNKQAAFGSALWRLGHHYAQEELTRIAEDMILQRILPMQFKDGYWNYGDYRDEPKTSEDQRQRRLDNYQILTLLKLTYLLPYERWRSNSAFEQAMLRGCRYLQSQIDPTGCVTPYPDFTVYREDDAYKGDAKKVESPSAAAITCLTRVGLAYRQPQLLEMASRVTNWMFHNRPVLLPFFSSGNAFLGLRHQITSSWGYSLCARHMLIAAYEGWHIHRRDAWTVELVHSEEET